MPFTGPEEGRGLELWGSGAYVRYMRREVVPALLFCLLPLAALAQESARDSTRGIPRFSLESGSVALAGPVRPWAYLADHGRRASVLGDENGSLEIWVWPMRVAHNFRLSFRLREADTLITAAAVARSASARAEGATIVYSHASFTVRQHVIVPLNDPGAIILLDVQSTVPLEIIAHMELGDPAATRVFWHPDLHSVLLTQQRVRLHTAIIGSPRATVGAVLPPRGERRAVAEFLIRHDPATRANEFIPIIVAAGASATDSIMGLYQRMARSAQTLWREKAEHYRRVRQNQVAMETPDPRFNQAYEWAKLGLDQQMVCSTDLGCGLVSGFTRAVGFTPAHGWYFSGDAALSALALTSVGNQAVARDALGFLARHQRVDGRIPRTSDALRWFSDFSLNTLHTDSTPFWLLACASYWQAAGDDAFIRQHWPAIGKAMRYAATAAPADGYTTAVWAAALEGVQAMAKALNAGDVALAAETLQARAAGRAAADTAITPLGTAAIAFGLLEESRATRHLAALSGAALTADWGMLRSTEVSTAVTAWAAWANFRAHRSWSGHDLLRDLSRATLDFARGRTPELLSGFFYAANDSAPPEHSAATALFANAVLKGMLGVQSDAPNRAIAVEPHLPAEWNTIAVNDLPVGRDRLHLSMRRAPGRISITLRRNNAGAPLFVRLSLALPLGAQVQRIRIDDADAPVQVEQSRHDVHAVVEVPLGAAAEIEIDYEGGLSPIAPAERMEPGDRSTGVRILDFTTEARDYVLVAEAAAGSTQTIAVRPESRIRSVAGAELLEQSAERALLRVRFDGTTPHVRREIRVRL